MKTKKCKNYVTYHINHIGGYTPIVVICKNKEEAADIIQDAISLIGISYVRYRTTSNYRNDSIVITSEEHFNYSLWESWQQTYYDRTFNPDFFPK